MNDKIQSGHRQRQAWVYLRQSTMKQVLVHQESTARQYALAQRAQELGWSQDTVVVVDDDLGHSGLRTEGRNGFQRLANAVAHGHVGLVLALEVSRLARSSVDWHRLLELCALADTLIADEGSIYAPADPNDRLLLGLKGQFSEAEQYWLRLRLTGGLLSKARRGELYQQPPIGYVWDADHSSLALDPNEEVRQIVALVFARFELQRSACAVVRYLRQKHLQLPARDPATGELRWGVPRVARVLGMLHNPRYAGAYVYGREGRARIGANGQRQRQRRQPLESWKICLQQKHPAYLSWEAFMNNQDTLRNNQRDPGDPGQRGAAREGAALLQGLVLCGKCGRRMSVQYETRQGRPRYSCLSAYKHHQQPLCWTTSGHDIDEAVANLFLSVACPPDIELALMVARASEQQAQELDQQWKLRLQRHRYEVQLAERRYKQVDPEHRVVAQTLERDWNERLLELQAAEAQHQQLRQQVAVDLTEADRQRIRSLVQDLPRVWHAPSTSQAQRKVLLRLLVQEVSLLAVEGPCRHIRVRVLWQTGAISELRVPRDRSWATGEAAADREVALWSIAEVAAHFGVTIPSVRYWMVKGWLTAVGGGGRGRRLQFEVDEATHQRLTELAANRRPPRPHSQRKECAS